MKIVVNSGNVGTLVAVELARQGHQVTLAVRRPQANSAWDRLGIRQAPFEINDVASMIEALKGGEAFFSLSPLVENLVESGVKSVQAAKAAGIRKIVRCSALGAAVDAAIQLGRIHYAVEQAVADSGLSFAILRPTSFMQNYLNFGNPESIKGQGAFYSPLGAAKVSLIDTRDIAAVAAKVVVEPGHEGKRYELTGGESLSNAEIADLFSNALGRKISYIGVSNDQAEESMSASGMPAWLVKLLSELNVIGEAGYLSEVKPDTAELLKRDPIRFSQFLSDHLGAFRS